ncbi:type II toxin-antitoxin system RelE/ParE family toxin [Sandarakinorhabdus sp.]|uniref:type II toxin-antitoxin system RelE/ParE family toxin n=1 Tax=Sandarakinorhabdus sp. TaxID=1916663 RepID=UPI003F70DC05
MKLRISADARRDLSRIDRWLGSIDGDLGGLAQDAIADRIELVLTNPAIGSPVPGGRRKIIERRFGYVILYSHNNESVTILRIRHAREDWR